jgi:hypothetical protein
MSDQPDEMPDDDGGDVARCGCETRICAIQRLHSRIRATWECPECGDCTYEEVPRGDGFWGTVKTVVVAAAWVAALAIMVFGHKAEPWVFQVR